MYRNRPSKAIIFKALYLAATIAVMGFAIYLLVDYIVYGFKNQLDLDDCFVLIASTVLMLFEGAIAGFIVRSFRAPTILMKNLVFKEDGQPYLAGILLVLAGVLITCALAVVFLVSAYGKSIIDIAIRIQRFIASVGLILFVNLLFTEFYFITFRHEAGTFTII